MSATILSPKAVFLQSRDAAERLNNLASTPEVHESLAMALAEMACRMYASDPLARAHNASMLEGAREFTSIWLNLGHQLDPPLPKEQWAALKK